MSASEHFREASRLLASVRDIVDERPEGAAPPSWCDARGWTAFLEAMPDDAVAAASRDGLAAHLEALPGAPSELVALARAVTRWTALPAMPAASAEAVDGRRASPRKRVQVAAFAAMVGRVGAKGSRVVDVGSGHGHLTRHLASALGVDAEGWERDPDRVAVASSLAGEGGARFVAMDARDPAATLRPTDLVVGLHACGGLGDHAVRAAGAAGASVALVGCCLQKREGDREALVVPAGMSARELTIGRAVLGLGNACDGEEGVEEGLAVRAASRVNRMALRAALLAAGQSVGPGEEMRGVNRRQATGPLAGLVERAFGLRGLPPPPAEAVEAAARGAAEAYERARRWALPRAMLARLVEVWVALDRAAWLRSLGYEAEVLVAFEASVSPRNVAVLGWRDYGRASPR
ncbi:MAG: methyltransferase [Myxococcaceae bacterium]|nr:MAG: methyltransferase [Myxococcaceae bacterium]